METKANYVLIGAFTLAAGIALLLFGLWASKFSHDRDFQEYRVVFNEAVTGLSPGSPVQYNGITVGSITKLSLAPNDPRQVIARIKLDAEAPVKIDTRAKLGQNGLTGPAIIQLSGGTPQAPRLVDVDKEDAPTIQTAPSTLQDIADTASHIVDRLNVLFSDQNVASLNRTLKNLDEVSGAVAAQKQDLQQLIVSARDTVQKLDATTDHLDKNLVQQLPGIVDKLDSTLTKLDSAAGNADAIMGENRSAINSFANDGLSQLGPTLSELRGLVRDLRSVSDRLEGNPARYLMGKDAPKQFDPRSNGKNKTP